MDWSEKIDKMETSLERLDIIQGILFRITGAFPQIYLLSIETLFPLFSIFLKSIC